VRQAVFREVAARLDAAWPCYAVEEVGFKLSRRGERIRENQLATFVGVQSQKEVPNLHLAAEPARVIINRKHPKTVLDHMTSDTVWS
jgi:type I restriction enzyme M protein